MRKILAVLTIPLFASSICYAAESLSLTTLTGSEIKNTIEDKTITTIPAAHIQNQEVLNDSFTGYFGKNGMLKGSFASPRKEGGSQKDEGTWRVTDKNELCYTWKNWDSGKENCVHLYKLKNGLLSVTNENNFESFIFNKDIQSGDKMQ